MNLDDMLTRSEAAAWLKMSEAELAAKSRGRFPKIPAFRLGQRTVLYHPRTIITAMSRRAGVQVEMIAASFGRELSK